MKIITFLFMSSLFSTVVGCLRSADCAEKLAARISVGSPQSEAEHALDACGFTYSFDQNSGTIHGLKRGGQEALVRQDWTAQVKTRRCTKSNICKSYEGFHWPMKRATPCAKG